MSIKLERINSALVKEISYVLATEIKDKDIQFVTVTDVRTANDLSYAKVYVTVLEDEKRVITLKALNDASGFIRSQLFDRIDLRNIPKLEFVYDESIAYGKKIENIIEEIHEEK